MSIFGQHKQPQTQEVEFEMVEKTSHANTMSKETRGSGAQYV
ncbi:hypothetical protein TRICHSKD4_1546 [Roseibium sp. TrichSKD4]|nr:hypothetical protein TRICHSKD4_1546 [Roseibium sp. TrichSKD4]